MDGPLRRAQFVPALLVVVAFCRVAQSATPAAPFVAGFDRFARHGEIDREAGGRLLLSELSCTACHETKTLQLQPKLGPQLDGVATRLNSQWIRQFLAAPLNTKPGTTMPDVLSGLPEQKREHAADALAAFLSTLHKPFPTIKAGGVNPVPYEFWNKGNADHGRRLYHQVGCVACHEPDVDYEVATIKPSPLDELLNQLDAEDLVEMGLVAAARRVKSAPHAELPAKYSVKSLTFFLLNPEATRPSGRMPSLKLQAVEAADIAAYLLRNRLRNQTSVATSKQDELIREGKRLFGELRCAQCHAVTGVKANKPARPLAKLDGAANGSCFAKPQAGRPYYSLDKAQIAAVRAAIADPVEDANTSAAHSLQFQMLQLNCYACHERDKQGGVGRYRKPYFETVGHVDIGDEGRLPPPLTAVGRKLQTAWLQTVFKGEGDVRPFMQIRMPKYPQAIVKSLPGRLARTDGFKQVAEKEVFGDRQGLAAAGRELMNVGCVECHQFRGESLPGTVGIELKGVTERIHPNWFREFLLDPGSLKPRTRMPTFFPGGKSQNQEVLQGDSARQIAAMWTYLLDIDKHPLPEKIKQARSQDYELTPKDRPIILRTFMDNAGKHAIAVGFPQRVHFAFDAEHVRLAQAWRGRFLDAQGTWFERFAPPADPLGTALISLPPGVPLAILKNNRQTWPSGDAQQTGYRFSGYRLDTVGVPTFLYRCGQFDVEDRIEPGAEQGLRRRLTIKNRKPGENTPPLWLRANVGKTLQRKVATTTTNDQGLTVKISEALSRQGELRKRKKTTEWILQVNADTETTIEVQYTW